MRPPPAARRWGTAARVARTALYRLSVHGGHPLVVGGLHGAAQRASASIVDQHVEAAEAAGGGLHDALGVVRLRHVGSDGDHFGAMRLQRLLGLVEAFLAPGTDRHPGAFPGEFLGHAAADALARAGYQDSFAYESKIHGTHFLLCARQRVASDTTGGDGGQLGAVVHAELDEDV